MKLYSAFTVTFLLSSHVAALTRGARQQLRPLGGGSGSGNKKKKGGLSMFCQQLAANNAACPTPDGSCPLKGICRHGETVEKFCTEIANVEDCGVDGVEVTTCTDTLNNACGCINETIDCLEVGQQGGEGGRPGGRGRPGERPGAGGPGGERVLKHRNRKGGKKGGKGKTGGKKGNFEDFCTKLQENITDVEAFPACPTKLICQKSGGDLTSFCTEISNVDDATCSVSAVACISALTARGCPTDDSIACLDQGQGEGKGKLLKLCKRMEQIVVDIDSNACPTRDGKTCPTKAICHDGNGSVANFCNAIVALTECSIDSKTCVDIAADNCGCSDENIVCGAVGGGPIP